MFPFTPLDKLFTLNESGQIDVTELLEVVCVCVFIFCFGCYKHGISSLCACRHKPSVSCLLLE